MEEGESPATTNKGEVVAPETGRERHDGRPRSPRRMAKAAIVLVAVAAAVVLRLWVFETDIVEGNSMVPGLRPGDYILISKLGRTAPRRFDIITFRAPSGKDVLIKRVVGLPGEFVWIWGGHVFVDGGWLREPYVSKWKGGFDAPVGVGRDSIYVLGDNRDSSEDSRIWGPIPLSSVRGRAMLVFFPFQRARIIR
jgi:signal peptidase I